MPHQHSNRNELVLRHYGLVHRIARHIHSRLPGSVELDDLVSVGVVGLIDAMTRFNPSRGVPFDTYARHRIRGAILDNLRAADWVPHSVRRKAQAIERARRALTQVSGTASEEDVAARLGLGVEQYRSLLRDSAIRQLLSLDCAATDDNATPLVEMIPADTDLEGHTADSEVRALVLQAVELLPEREGQAISLYYFQGLALKEVGQQLGVTESRACQLCGQGIKRLRHRLREAA